MNASIDGQDHTLAIFAHELREPLASILLAASAMAETPIDLSVHHELCALIERQGRYLSGIINGVLRAGHAGRHRPSLHKESFDLSRVIADTIEATAPAFRERGHHLSVSAPPGPICVLADPLRVQQVLINLLANAAKFTEPGGSIRLTVNKTGSYLTIEVRDDGVGMEPALLARVFDLFAQGNQLSSAEYSGLGVGLALVKSLVELHGGTVSACSDGLGTGSTFTVRLPISSLNPSRQHLLPRSQRNLLTRNPYEPTTPILDA